MDVNFHISLPCRHIDATQKFYTKIIGATKGRKSQNWVDINLFGHQITFTKSGNFKFDYPSYIFEKTVLPSFHFGVILSNDVWQDLYKKLKAEDFLYIDETHFLADKPGEHKSFFLRDPNGYIIEFKCFANQASVFEV
ncbi:MAG TPA: VOC family protein [Flavobacteriaceae bacterium]|nr:VOC family protein [Flavobacteriaceae bacterium]MCB9213897.1 VOC family protein [Alteromonas sp.]HPF11118.1 VOC family protein [Flavobacteriaceae bacterium]HQU21214.1 VOC family protein [Flavobacteriaceae bacterium]HQU65686.1 VOC family protein [Flavobacteriaceae bacterium]